MKVPYLPGDSQESTLLGTRSGASALAVWTLLKHLGRVGYSDIVKRCLGLTWKLVKGIQQIDGLDIVIKPTMNVVGIKSDKVNIRQIFMELKKCGWAVSLFPEYLRIVIMPHIKALHIQGLLEELKAIIDY